MSQVKIQNGWGSGALARVGEDGLLQTKSISTPILEYASAKDGQAYVFSTGDFIDLTSNDTESAILYIKNTSVDKILCIYDIRTCGLSTQLWKLYLDDDAGTIVTDANAGLSENLNLSSSNNAEADCYRGADSKTRSGGRVGQVWINSMGHSVNNFEGALILGTGNSITLTAEMPTADKCCAMISAYYEVTS